MIRLEKAKFETKDLGYDDRSGRFFEIPEIADDKGIIIVGTTDSSNDNSNTAGGVSMATTITSGEDTTPLTTRLENNQPSITTPPTKLSDIVPPLFPIEDDERVIGIGRNIAGEKIINGVKMTSSSTETTITGGGGLADRLASAGAVSAAAMATAAVNAAVSMKSLTAPSVEKSYISMDSSSSSSSTATDEEGLPLVYDKDLIEKYWKKERGALNQRWSYFVGKAVPFFTKLVTLFISEGEINERHIPELSRQARLDLQDLGPTFIKAGQMMSVRPDVLPQATLYELTKLQDAVIPFDTQIAVQQIEDELGGPLGQFFTSISEEPVAAASLAQVYLATLNDGKDTRVAVKVQRPNILSIVSKDLYVLRRAAEVFQGLVERFAPQQRTNYVGLLNEWSIGFYTELDFSNVSQCFLCALFESSRFLCSLSLPTRF